MIKLLACRSTIGATGISEFKLKKKNCLGLISVADGGGVRKVNAMLADGFSKRGWSVKLVSPRMGNPYFKDVPPIVDLKHLAPKSNPIKFLVSLLSLIYKKRSLVLLCSQDQVIVAVWLLSIFRFVKQTKIAIVHNNPVVHKKHRKFIARALPLFLKKAYQSFDSVVCVSEGLKQELVDKGYINPKKARVIYNPVITNVEQPFQKNLHSVSRIHKRPYLVAAGNLNQQKDFKTLILAFDFLKNEYNGDLIILGKGPLKPELYTLVKTHDLLNRIYFKGFVDNPLMYFSCADCFVLSSQWEGFGNVIVEALHCGCPVVSTDCDFGPSEILMSGKYGRLVPVGDSKKLASAILQEMESPSAKRTARQSRAAEFSLLNSVLGYEVAIRDLIDSGSI